MPVLRVAGAEHHREHGEPVVEDEADDASGSYESKDGRRTGPTPGDDEGYDAQGREHDEHDDETSHDGPRAGSYGVQPTPVSHEPMTSTVRTSARVPAA